MGDVNKFFVFKSLLTMPGNFLPLHLKQTFLPIIWIFAEGEGDGIKSRLPFKIFSTLPYFWIFIVEIINLNYSDPTLWLWIDASFHCADVMADPTILGEIILTQERYRGSILCQQLLLSWSIFVWFFQVQIRGQLPWETKVLIDFWHANWS